LGNYLHSAYPPQLWPLRRDQAIEQILTQISEWAEGDGSNTVDETPAQLESGEVILPVGPVHASVIEPGRFYFRVAGDEIRDVQIKLGYTHKGVERLFQSSFSLRDGWRLAECIAADSAFAHSLAYCQAVESLTCVRVPCRAEYLRALFMELERIGNHIADVAAIAHDIASVLLASILAELREKMLRLNDRIAGHRLLRGLNRPGGIELKRPLSADDIWRTLREIGSKLREEGDYLIELAGFRDRAIGVGVLPEKLARDNGATGFVARASGLLERDFRLTHPYGLYRDEKYHRLLSEEAKLEKRMSTRSATGDVYARVVLRFEEAQISIKLIEHMLDDWLNLPEEELCNSIDRQLRATPNFATGLGYVEGWRGDIVYWVMKDKFDRIYRCKVRDPSTLNWPTLREAIIPRASGDPRTAKHTLLADFPLINKSFNLSYSGNDL
jgi:Ni,Fe-hydrogenase III large subunit